MFALLELEHDGTEQYNRTNNTTDLKNKDCRFRRVADLVVFGWVCLFFSCCHNVSSVFCNKTRLTQSPHPLSQLPWHKRECVLSIPLKQKRTKHTIFITRFLPWISCQTSSRNSYSCFFFYPRRCWWPLRRKKWWATRTRRFKTYETQRYGQHWWTTSTMNAEISWTIHLSALQTYSTCHLFQKAAFQPCLATLHWWCKKLLKSRWRRS